MRPTISEFSYGYAVTDELIHCHSTTVTAAPVFPSLYQEGQAGGGYDLHLQRPGIPLFLQFKLADCMVRDTASEAQAGLLTIPFYRMHLRPSRHSDQHHMLLDLENAGNDVFYCVPEFHTPAELDSAYLQRRIRTRSLWLWPSLIGRLPNRNDHHCSFQNASATYFYFCSKPQLIEAEPSFEHFEARISGRIRQSGKTALSQDSLSKLTEMMERIGRVHTPVELYDRKVADAVQKLSLTSKIAFYAQVFFQSQLFIAHVAE